MAMWLMNLSGACMFALIVAGLIFVPLYTAELAQRRIRKNSPHLRNIPPPIGLWTGILTIMILNFAVLSVGLYLAACALGVCAPNAIVPTEGGP